MRLGQEQEELKDLVRRFFSDAVTSEYLRARSASGVRSDPELLASLDQLGFEEAFGATPATLSFVELALISEEVGRALVPEPLIERIFGSYVIPRLLSGDALKAYTDAAPSGALIAFAHPASSALALSNCESKVSGEILWGFGLENATHVIAFIEEARGRKGCVVPLLSPGVTMSLQPSIDLTTSLARVDLVDAPASLLDPESARVVQDGFEVLKACEVAGICEKVIEMTSEYVRTREQFGVPIGGFQAIQHKLADMYAQSEALRALCRFAAWSVIHSPEQRSLTARAAAAKAAEVGPLVCEVAIQCHGGIGFTWEFDLHLYLRRVKLIESVLALSEQRADELIESAR